MFESAEIGHKLDKATYKKLEPKLRDGLLLAQQELLASKRFPVVVLISGVDGAGKGETVHQLHEWMDPRHLVTRAFGPETDVECERPRMYRYWTALPPKGRIGILFGSWYTTPVVDRVHGRTKNADLDQEIERINRFEKMLVDDGALVLKLWFHLSKAKQKKRLKALESDPATRYRVTKADWKNFELYDKFRKVSEHTVRETSTGAAPWIVIEGEDPEYRAITAGTVILEALRSRLASKREAPREPEAPRFVPSIDGVELLDRLDMTRRLPKADYEAELAKWQGKLSRLFRDRRFRTRSVVSVFEGNDAAGKGGSIRRVTSALDPRQYTTIPVAAPTEEERAMPYLWRFWQHLPAHGSMTIFDRSWYGRVLVERVEGLASEFDWMRAYSEINDFEEQLVENGTIVVKYWLAVTKEEQLARFEEREKTSYKRFKITKDDWRNRKKWAPYQRAVNDMVDRTSTEIARWTLVPANDKYSARIDVLKTLVTTIEAAL